MENMDKGLTNKMGADSLAKIPQMPQNLSAQANSSGFQWKKASLGVRSPWLRSSILLPVHVQKSICVKYLKSIRACPAVHCTIAQFNEISFVKKLNELPQPPSICQEESHKYERA